MTGNTEKIPYRLNRIVEEFRLCEGTEKIELLLHYAKTFPSLPTHVQHAKESMDWVQECLTPVLVHSEVDHEGRMSFYFDIPAESPTVRGFAVILSEGLNGLSPKEILAVPGYFYRDMELESILSNQRMQGFRAILSHMKRLALEELSTERI
jgi:cysteine desulfuration protein SufE